MDRTNFTKNDFKDGDIVTLRNGARLIFIDGDFLDCEDNVDNDLTRPGDLTSDLKHFFKELLKASKKNLLYY